MYNLIRRWIDVHDFHAHELIVIKAGYEHDEKRTEPT